MERNTDPQKVVIAAELYDELLAMARDSGRYTTSRIDRHVRKFNPTRQAPHQARVLEFEEKRSQLIRDARAVMSESQGKVVYVLTHVNHYNRIDYPCYLPVVLKRVSKDKRWELEVYRIEGYDHEGAPKLGRCEAVSAKALITELPEDYIQLCQGRYRRVFAPQWSTLHWFSMEEDARNIDEERTRYLKPKEYATESPRKMITFGVDVER